MQTAMNGPFSENTDTPLSTSTTISSQQHWAESEGGEVSPLIPVERSNEGEASSLPQRKMVLDSKGTVMWKGCAAAGTTRSEETTSQDQFPISRLSSSRGLDLKRACMLGRQIKTKSGGAGQQRCRQGEQRESTRTTSLVCTL